MEIQSMLSLMSNSVCCFVGNQTAGKCFSCYRMYYLKVCWCIFSLPDFLLILGHYFIKGAL